MSSERIFCCLFTLARELYFPHDASNRLHTRQSHHNEIKFTTIVLKRFQFRANDRQFPIHKFKSLQRVTLPSTTTESNSHNGLFMSHRRMADKWKFNLSPLYVQVTATTPMECTYIHTYIMYTKYVYVCNTRIVSMTIR